MGFNACRIVPYRHVGGDYLLICGSSRQCQLFSSEGYPLGPIADCNKWVWAAAAKPNSTVVVNNEIKPFVYLVPSTINFHSLYHPLFYMKAVGSEDGTVGCHQLMFSTVHGLYKERYAFRYAFSDQFLLWRGLRLN